MSPDKARRLQLPLAIFGVAAFAFLVSLMVMNPLPDPVQPGRVAEQIQVDTPETVAKAPTVDVQTAQKTVTVAVPPRKQQPAPAADDPVPAVTTPPQPAETTPAQPNFTPTYPTPVTTTDPPVTTVEPVPFCAQPNPTHPACQSPT